MNKTKNLLEQWLSNPKRKYADGLVLFNALATDALRTKYGQFLKDADPDEQHQFSPEMSILTNKLAQLRQMAQIKPEMFDGIEIITEKDDVDITAKNEEIESLKEEIEDLNGQLDDKDSDNTELQDLLDEKEEQLEKLETELKELLEKRGLQIVERKNLPKKIQALYDRNREITPLMASLHAEISNENLPEEKRAELVDELCKLDDERRTNWDKIDSWSEGKDVKIDQPEKVITDSDPIIAGMMMANRIIRLKENIKRSQESAESGKTELIRANAAKRVETYKTELAELENMVSKKDIVDAE